MRASRRRRFLRALASKGRRSEAAHRTAHELVALSRMVTRPHALLGMEVTEAEAMRFDVTMLRAAERYRATEAGADMQRLESDDPKGVGRVLAMLYRDFVTG